MIIDSAVFISIGLSSLAIGFIFGLIAGYILTTEKKKK